MKKTLLVICLGFWCSYGVAGYVDDQVRNYCIEFMDIYLEADLSYTIGSENTTSGLRSYIFLGLDNTFFWECNVSKIDRTSNIKTHNDYTIYLRGVRVKATASNGRKKNMVNALESSRQTQAVTVPVGGIGYRLEGVEYIMYVVVTNIVAFPVSVPK